MKTILAPSILSADFRCLEEQIRTAVNAGGEMIHVDVMDGHYVPNITMGPLVVEAVRKSTDIDIDVHLMIEKPERYLQAFADAGADYLTVHVETCPHIHRTLQAIREMGCKAGITLNPGTPTEQIRPLLHMVDLVLVMSVNPGFGGQKFIPESLERITQIRGWLDEMGSDASIQVDGGVNEKTIKSVRDAGSNVLVAGSAIFNHPGGAAAGVEALLKALEH